MIIIARKADETRYKDIFILKCVVVTQRRVTTLKNACIGDYTSQIKVTKYPKKQIQAG